MQGILRHTQRLNSGMSAGFGPLRPLLLRQKSGELPWMVRALIDYMAPAQVVPVVGLSNALWRLGRERFERFCSMSRSPTPLCWSGVASTSPTSLRFRCCTCTRRRAKRKRSSNARARASSSVGLRPTGTKSRACPGSGAPSVRRVRRSRRRPPSPDRRATQIKIREAGLHEYVRSPEMFLRLFARFRERRVLP